MWPKLIAFLIGLALIALGVRSIIRQEAQYSWSNDPHSPPQTIEGFPAILIGLSEIASGLYAIFGPHTAA